MVFETKRSLVEKVANSFNIKFTKYKNLDEDKINFHGSIVVSPVQAKLVDVGKISSKQITSKYKEKVNLKQVIGDYASLFNQGSFFNFYLSPKDKHYWRLPYEGKFIHTQLNQPKTKIPVFIGLERLLGNCNLFEKAIKKNASIGSVLLTPKFPMAMIAVGSLFVNGIKINYENNKFYHKGEVLGYFKIGSSMLLCFPNINNLEPLIEINQKVNIGEKIMWINP